MAAEKKEVKEKPFDKMTVKELREVAKEISEIIGVHGMNKEELLSAIKKAKGIAETPQKKGAASTKVLKSKIKELKARKLKAIDSEEKKTAAIYRRKIARLKKRTRRAA